MILHLSWSPRLSKSSGVCPPGCDRSSVINTPGEFSSVSTAECVPGPARTTRPWPRREYSECEPPVRYNKGTEIMMFPELTTGRSPTTTSTPTTPSWWSGSRRWSGGNVWETRGETPSLGAPPVTTETETETEAGRDSKSVPGRLTPRARGWPTATRIFRSQKDKVPGVMRGESERKYFNEWPTLGRLAIWTQKHRNSTYVICGNFHISVAGRDRRSIFKNSKWTYSTRNQDLNTDF